MPSSKVITFIVIAVLLVGGIISFDLFKKPEEASSTVPESQRKNVSVNLNENNNLTSADTDGDGLLDWEEALRGSDINNSDTDGDGTTDGHEVRLNRNPVVAGPDDSLEFLSGDEDSTEENSNIIFTEGTLSEKVSTNFISNFIELGGGEALDESTQSELSNTIATDAAALAAIPDKYHAEDIATFSNNNKDLAREYGNSFAEIVVNYFAVLSTRQNPNAGSYIREVSDAFGDFGKELSKLSVPKDLLDTHLSFINNLNRVDAALKGLIASKEDPLRALFVLGEYEEVESEQPQLFAEIADYFRTNDIIFNDEEFGIMWSNF